MKLITEQQTSKRKNILYNILKEQGYQSISHFQKANNLTIDGLFGMQSYNALYSLVLDTIDIAFKGYYKQVFEKKQIVWHHSAGHDSAVNMFAGWDMDRLFHVATSIGIEDSGRVVRGFDEKYWGHHIGMSNWLNLARNQESLAVEITNFGSLTEQQGKKYTYFGLEVDNSRVIELDYKGFKYYHSYTDAEIKALKYWTLLNAMRFDIPLAYSEKDMWEVSNNAINGIPGIYTHNSFISWKTDVSPQPKLIEMAKSLTNYEK